MNAPLVSCPFLVISFGWVQQQTHQKQGRHPPKPDKTLLHSNAALLPPPCSILQNPGKTAVFSVLPPMTGDGQLTRSEFIINYLLRNPLFSSSSM